MQSVALFEGISDLSEPSGNILMMVHSEYYLL